jgi:hypothetical protein
MIMVRLFTDGVTEAIGGRTQQSFVQDAKG